MTTTRPSRHDQFRSVADLLAYLSRDLQRLRMARTPADALDAALAFCVSAWTFTQWCWLPISRDMALRRQITRAYDRSLPSLDADTFAALLADQCPNLALCESIAADPRRLAVRADGSGWLLIEDGEAEEIGQERFDDVVVFWREFTQRYLADLPTSQRAA